ncbi:MAG: response regulator transcription factor [Prolixibacteraceae bacterium]|jgi:DNA-binding response OmpR family regulator|nr:response regulator transcription factor [Prolixibacteraceae bacterium]
MKRTKILLVEDDTSLGFLLVDFLESHNLDVKLYRDGESGLKGYKAGNFDFCILDVMLPGIDGFSLAKRIRAENTSIPIVFLTARSMKQDKIKGFDLGVDDYITKPFDEDELLCRINAIINRYNIHPNETQSKEIYHFGQFSFDYKNQLLKTNKNEKRLTQKESEVLRMLCIKPNEIVTRETILVSVWGSNDYFIGRSLDVFIAKLRKYLSIDPETVIDNIPKVGYILKTE